MTSQPVSWDAAVQRWRCRLCSAFGLHAVADDDGTRWRIVCAGPDAHEWVPEPRLRVLLGVGTDGRDSSPTVVYGGAPGGVRAVLDLPRLPPELDALAAYDGRTVQLAGMPVEGQMLTFPQGSTLPIAHVVHYPWGTDDPDDPDGGDGRTEHDSAYVVVILGPTGGWSP